MSRTGNHLKLNYINGVISIFSCYIDYYDLLSGVTGYWNPCSRLTILEKSNVCLLRLVKKTLQDKNN